MMIQEFEKLTGIYPTADLYAVIEAAYMEFDGDKTAFCKAYKSNKNGIAEKIQREANMAAFRAQNKHAADIASRDAEIERLAKEVEREQEWKPYTDADNVQQSDYEQLREDSSTRVMTDAEARDLLYNWYGFAPEKVKILHSVPTFEVNRHRQLRKTGEVERLPLYNATDWHYIRFDCGRMSYELDNDSLRPFVH